MVEPRGISSPAFSLRGVFSSRYLPVINPGLTLNFSSIKVGTDASGYSHLEAPSVTEFRWRLLVDSPLAKNGQDDWTRQHLSMRSIVLMA